MSAGRHAIVTTSPGPVTVLRGGPTSGVYTDDDFYALPIVRQFGGFPAGYAAIHFGADERASRLDNLARDPRDPAVVLRDLLTIIQASRYAVRLGDKTFGRTGSKADAERMLRGAVRRWRAGELLLNETIAPRWSHRYTAVRLDATWNGHSWSSGAALQVSWRLQDRGRSVGIIRVEDDGLRAAYPDATLANAGL